MKIIDNFLPKEDFKRLQHIVTGTEISWFWNFQINYNHDSNDTTSYFTHNLFNYNNDYIYSNYFLNFKDIFWEKLNMKSLIRMKLNLYIKTDKLETHEPHIDYPYSHKGCIFSFNTCDGGTIMEDGKKIESIENRALIFDADKPHSSTSCTNAKARINMNINYF